MIADTGNFGEFCPGPGTFKDLAITVDNRGTCPLLVTGLASSSPEFQTPQVLTFPIKVAPGDNIAVPFRFQPTSAGAKAATLTRVDQRSGGADEGRVGHRHRAAELRVRAAGLHVDRRRDRSDVRQRAHRQLHREHVRSFPADRSDRTAGSASRSRASTRSIRAGRRGSSTRQPAVSPRSLAGGRRRQLQGRQPAIRGRPGSAQRGHGQLRRAAADDPVRGVRTKGLKETRRRRRCRSSVGPVAPPGGQPIIAMSASSTPSTRSAARCSSTSCPPLLARRERRVPEPARAGREQHRRRGGARVTTDPAVARRDGAVRRERELRRIVRGRHGHRRRDDRPLAKPSDWSNPVNPLGTLVPRVHYEVFDRIR